MKFAHADELVKADIGVIATARNEEGIEQYVAMLIKQKAKILRDFKKNQRPYFSIIQKSGAITTEFLGLNRPGAELDANKKCSPVLGRAGGTKQKPSKRKTGSNP